jgi:integrase
MPMRKSQVDFENRLVHIPDSKTPSGEGDMPMTAAAVRAFREQCQETPGSEYLFPSPKPTAKKPYITHLKKVWRTTLRKAGVAYSRYMSCGTLLPRASAREERSIIS